MRDVMEKEIQKKKKNPLKIILTMLAAWLGCAILCSIIYFGFFAKVKFAYNGIEYDGLEAHVYIEIDNKSTNQIEFDRTNFSIRGNSVSKTANSLYIMRFSGGSYNHQYDLYNLNSSMKVKVMLVFYRADITTDCSIYFNGELISKL